MEDYINNLKAMYNQNLSRYYNGCEYCKEHKKEADKWIAELLNIMNKMNLLLKEIMEYEIVNLNDILEGFNNKKGAI